MISREERTAKSLASAEAKIHAQAGGATPTPEIKRSIFQRLNDDAANKKAAKDYGTLRPQIICPQCQERGKVRCKTVKNKKGISGGKATGAILTVGVSMLATGLSRKETATEAHCGNCQSTWQF